MQWCLGKDRLLDVVVCCEGRTHAHLRPTEVLVKVEEKNPLQVHRNQSHQKSSFIEGIETFRAVREPTDTDQRTVSMAEVLFRHSNNHNASRCDQFVLRVTAVYTRVQMSMPDRELFSPRHEVLAASDC